MNVSLTDNAAVLMVPAWYKFSLYTAVDEDSIRERPTGLTSWQRVKFTSVCQCPLSGCIRHEGG